MSNSFNPIAYIRDVRAHPEAYCTTKEVKAIALNLQTIRAAKDLAELRKLFTPLARTAKDAKDDELLAMLTKAKDERKAQLEAI